MFQEKSVISLPPATNSFLSLKSLEYINIFYFTSLTVDTKCLPLHCKCVLVASSFLITFVDAEYLTRIGFQTNRDVTGHAGGPAS